MAKPKVAVGQIWTYSYDGEKWLVISVAGGMCRIKKLSSRLETDYECHYMLTLNNWVYVSGGVKRNLPEWF